jgi:hypothetical protein
MANLITFVHVGSAVAVVFTFLVLFRGGGMGAIALGMGLTTSAFAVASIAARRAILGASSRRRGLLRVTGAALSLGGELAIAAIGGLLLLHSP